MKLADRLTADTGTHYLPGLQALVRFPMEQVRRDRAAGLRIGTFISGYPGSPLAGFDLSLSRIPELLEQHDVAFVPAGNEELAMTAHMGTQMLDDHPHQNWDGVTSIWYGKGPGVDRSGDALKHGNFAGTSENGAVVILSGEDHEAKSSTMPFQQEYAFVSAGVPILYPATVAEFRTFGLHAINLSRFSGCWVAMKLTTAICDSAESVTIDASDVDPVYPDVVLNGVPFRKRTDFTFFPGKNIEMERHLYQEKHEAVREYARANQLDRIEVGGEAHDRVGIITAGKAFGDIMQAFADLGLTREDLAAAGVRVLKLGLIYPMDESAVIKFAGGLDRIFVVEEKRDFIEQQVRAALQRTGRQVTVVGKRDEHNDVMIPVQGAIDADLVARRLCDFLGEVVAPRGSAATRLQTLDEVEGRSYLTQSVRTPNFCSGCPHSSSTRLAPGQVAWGAPGCNCFNAVIEQPDRHIDVMTQFGGEGLPWIGLNRYTDREHMVQHIGDGSLYHSSYLNIRWAVATGVNITFKVLYNGVVANTGAQKAIGEHGLADLTRGLESEGVERIVLLTKLPRKYRRTRLAKCVEVRPSHRMVETAEELSRIPGCTVMIYDESCANERRRLQKRGKVERPTEFVIVNESVCENCGDCGAKSNCMSLQKVPTEFGDKTKIHTSSCNQDFSCIDGDCPAFATVTTAPNTGYVAVVPPSIEVASLTAPTRPALADKPFSIYMPGVGGTGVLTLNGILSVAGLLDGYAVRSYDQTGAAQKWGPVVSSLTLAPREELLHTSKVGKGQADLYLALDEVGGANPTNLDRCSPDKTIAVSNTDLFPTGEQVRDVHAQVDTAGIRSLIESYSREQYGVRARWIADELFGDYMLTNMVVLGAAYQVGAVPISAASLERAIELNGVSVELNKQAFRYGRLWISNPERIIELIEPPQTTASEELENRRAGLPARRRQAYDEIMANVTDLPDPVVRLLAVRVAELIHYAGKPRLAADYLRRMREFADREAEVRPGSIELTMTAGRSLFKLMAYKDEYEVARLYLQPEFAEQVNRTFANPVKVSYNLYPPAARAFGRKRKLRLGPWFRPAFAILKASRRIRGTWVDPFRGQASRREERGLILWYENLLDEIRDTLAPANFPIALEIADIPDAIRGYEEVKSRSAELARLRADDLLPGLRRPRLPLVFGP